MSYEHRGLVIGVKNKLLYVLPIYSYDSRKHTNVYHPVDFPSSKSDLYLLKNSEFSWINHDSILNVIKKEIPLLLLSGMAMGINWILLFQAYKYTTISAVTLSYYFAPVIVTITCLFLFHEKLTGKQITCFCMSTVGLFLIIGIGNVGQGSNNLLGILLGLGAAVFYAAVILLNKFIKNVAGIHRTLLQFFAAILILIPYVAATGGMHLAELNTTGWLCLLTVGIVHTGITYCMYFSTLKDLAGHETAILSYIDPLVAVFISVLVLGEKMTFVQMLGGIFILGFTLWNEK